MKARKLMTMAAGTLAAGLLLTGVGDAVQAVTGTPAYAATHHRMGRHTLMGAIVHGQSITIDGRTYRAYPVTSGHGCH